MTTIKTYQEDVYLKEISAMVFDISFDDGITSIVCDRTIFFPTGGGQPCDTGYINEFEIFDVSETEAGEVVHRTKDIPSEEAGMDLLGTEVNMKINWNRRFRNMQRHLGEHLLSGTIHSLYNGVNKGFHMGENYITIDIETPDGLLDEEMIAQAELKVNKVIQENHPVTIKYFANSYEASTMPVRKPINIEGAVSIVTAGNIDNPVDCVACCGTHPSYTGEVGLIKIYKSEPNKGMTRIYFDAGMDALNRCIKEMALLKTISDHFSCSEDDLLHTIKVKEANESTLKNTVSTLATSLISYEVNRILQDILSNETSGLYLIRDLELDTDRSLKMGFKLLDKLKNYPYIDSLLLAILTENNTVLLLSNGTIKCGELVKSNVKAHNGKGGGRNDNARAKFSSLADANSFIEDIKSVIISQLKEVTTNER